MLVLFFLILPLAEPPTFREASTGMVGIGIGVGAGVASAVFSSCSASFSCSAGAAGVSSEAGFTGAGSSAGAGSAFGASSAGFAGSAGFSGAGAALYYLSGNTEFFWNTYQSLPAAGFNGIAVALLAVNNPIAVIFTGCFMSMLNIAGLQLANLTAYNEYITDVIIAVIVYLAAFSLIIKMWLGSRQKKAPAAQPAAKADSASSGDAAAKEGDK